MRTAGSVLLACTFAHYPQGLFLTRCRVVVLFSCSCRCLLFVAPSLTRSSERTHPWLLFSCAKLGISFWYARTVIRFKCVCKVICGGWVIYLSLGYTVIELAYTGCIIENRGMNIITRCQVGGYTIYHPSNFIVFYAWYVKALFLPSNFIVFSYLEYHCLYQRVSQVATGVLWHETCV